MSIQLADQSIKYPVGVYENLLVKINRFIFPADFVVLKMDEDELVSIILGWPFLITTRAVIDVRKGKLSLKVSSKTITFNIGKSMKFTHFHDDYLYCADHTIKLDKEQWVDTIYHDGEWVEPNEKCNPEEIRAVSFYPRQEPVKPLEWKALENHLKPSISEPPKLELKELPEHLEYAFLQGNDQLPIVISSTLSIHEKAKLLEVLRNYKGAISWSVADIKGYFQIPIALEDQEKTTFTCPDGTFAYKRMPFGLCNAPATFQRCMMAIFHELIKDSMEVFMDDFSVFGSSFDHCLANLEKMRERCEETNLV
ncbi:reverse transcriptase domain-containing protein [Tanacetum coccineum]